MVLPVALTRNQPPPSEERLDALERSLGVPLPEDYRQFLATWNGGHPEPNDFFFGEHAYQDSCVDFFLSLYDGEYHNLERYIADSCDPQWRRIPAELIPIANDPGSSLVCLAVHGPQRGAVFFWDHFDWEDDGGTWDNVHRIARSFDEFLRVLR